MAIAASGRSNEPTKPWSPLHFLCLVDDPDCMPFRLNGRPPQAHNLAVCNQRARPSCPRVLSTRPLRESVMEAKKRIGDYEILGELGSGGMGRVFRVRNVISDRVEAMKVLLPDLVGRQDLAARFLREIKVLAALNHPNIAALRTALTADNQLVMIMEYVEGQSVADRLAQGPIATADAIKYIDQVLDALSYAHAQGVVHRDIKPANMMLTPERSREGDGLRDRPVGWRSNDHRCGDDDRLAELHVARAGQRRRDRSAIGSLLGGRVVVRDGDGRAALQGGQ